MSDLAEKLAEYLYGHSREKAIEWAKEDKFDSCYRKAEDIIELLGVERLRAENATLRQALNNHAEEAAKMVNAEPVAYWNGKGSIIPAEDVSYLPNWSDYYPIPLYRRPQA